jgi:unconventional prefoldin RPB5 interactor 1
VLLGEGYYVERSAKQTTEILHRRGMELEAQVEAMKATISDLEAEAKFFESTAAEASVRLSFLVLYVSGRQWYVSV